MFAIYRLINWSTQYFVSKTEIHSPAELLSDRQSSAALKLFGLSLWTSLSTLSVLLPRLLCEDSSSGPINVLICYLPF